MTTTLLLQVLLTFSVKGEGPVRFGFPLPESALARGLAVEGIPGAVLQWRALQPAAERAHARRWCEVAVGGPGLRGPGRKVLRLVVGRNRASASGSGVVFTRTSEVAESGGLRTTVTAWQFADGDHDRRERVEVLSGELVHGEERFASGEAITSDSQGLRSRTLRVVIAPAEWARAGVIPQPTRLCAGWRDHLCAVGKQMPTLPGVRGAGDFARSGGIVTNLEFDTTLGFVRLGLASGDDALLARALQSARHLVDHDIEPASGLPFAHGLDHRDHPPEPGHAWLQGLLLAGCVFADDDLIAAAFSLARGLARQPRAPPAARSLDRARDIGWPLVELEAMLRFRGDPALQRAAERLAQNLIARYDERAGVIRFGEGERRGGAYEERAWITGGILVPGLRAHAARTRDTKARAIVTAMEERLLALLRRGQRGLPIRYWVDRDGLGTELRLSGTAEAFLLLEGLGERGCKSILARGQVAACLEGVPRADDPDLATQFSIAARCEWILR